MAARANWKGTLKIGELSCPVALYTAASTSDRIAFHTINRATGNRVRREFVDAETGKPVDREHQVKGYEVTEGEHILLDPEDIAAAVPDSDKMLSVEAFLPCGAVDDVYFDKPYYLAPSDKTASEAFGLIRAGLEAKKVAAIARTVLFRRLRTVLIRAHGAGLVATTLNFDYEVRAAEAAFKDIPAPKVAGEMLDLARHIIKTKMGTFDPASFEDRYEDALQELVRAKMEGRKIAPRKQKAPEKVVDLMEALRASAGVDSKEKSPAKPRAKAGTKSAAKSSTGKPATKAPPKRKAG
ncbi:Ku protein [Pseudotabrizicola algicola]|uniref:Non-homologous end joining protein Ku n=1 Tax=Pseudotabrizicola algicola TaxID=2709381 RepID=A0A6B3RKY5_9RHOB|nr:Ku protein [Pseudotabrizicola algicola]NEX45906.1 Ku protein [Pseudotabrizicola algicola]